MSDRRKILEFFEEQKDYLDSKVKDGIEKHRKGEAKITVLGRDGRPISNASVRVTQKTHEFRFGANIFMLDELETEEKNNAYKKAFADVFNMATLPFYWDTLELERGKPRYEKDSPKVYRRPAPDLCLEFCEKHGIEPREHALAYDHFFPEWLADAPVDEVKRELERRFAEISERYADKIPTIEVTNEMEWWSGVTSFYDEPDYIEWCFKTAEKYFPNNTLCINEGTTLSWRDRGRVTDKYYAYIEANMLKGARIDAIGMQYHIHSRLDEEYEKTTPILNPKKLYKHLDLYAGLGKPIQITEITIPAYSWETEDEEIQAEILEKLYSIWFSHPSIEQIIYWNLVDGYSYVKGTNPHNIKETLGNMAVGENYYYGGLLRFDMSEKPAFTRLKELIQRKWHTEESLGTDADGIASFRGFYGSYEAKIEADGISEARLFSIKKGNHNNIVIQL